MRAHIQDMLAWVTENEIACIPQEFCDLSRIGRTTLKRHEDLAELVNQYGWKTSRARMRHGTSSRTAKARERVDNRILREHGRWKTETARLAEELAAADAQIAALRANVQRLTGYTAQLENYTDVLVHELAIRDRQSGRRIGLLLQSVKEGSLPAEFMDAIRQSNQDLTSNSGAQVSAAPLDGGEVSARSEDVRSRQKRRAR